MATLVRASTGIGRITRHTPRERVWAIVAALAVGAVCFAAAFTVARSTRSSSHTGASPVRFGSPPAVKDLDRAAGFPALRRRATPRAATSAAGGSTTATPTVASPQQSSSGGGPRRSSSGNGGASGGAGSMLVAPPPPAQPKGQASPRGAATG
jgi:uncharacterized membrane protein YgcG